MTQPLRTQLRVQPVSEPLGLTEAKDYLRVTGSDDDNLITSLIVASRQACEAFTHRTLITQEWSMWLDSYPTIGRMPWWDGVREGAYVQTNVPFIELPKNPIQSVDVINTYAEDDTVTIWATTNYSVDLFSQKARIALKKTGIVPANLREINGLEIQFTSGYGSLSTDVPNSLIEGMKSLVSYLYDNRGCPCDTTAVVESSADRLWSPYIVYGGL